MGSDARAPSLQEGDTPKRGERRRRGPSGRMSEASARELPSPPAQKRIASTDVYVRRVRRLSAGRASRAVQAWSAWRLSLGARALTREREVIARRPPRPATAQDLGREARSAGSRERSPPLGSRPRSAAQPAALAGRSWTPPAARLSHHPWWARVQADESEPLARAERRSPLLPEAPSSCGHSRSIT
jgi:hypothetical protein